MINIIDFKNRRILVLRELQFSKIGTEIDQTEWIATDIDGDQYTEEDSMLSYNYISLQNLIK